MTTDAFKHKISQLTSTRTPFLFIIDFECRKPFVCTIQEAEQHHIFFDIKGSKNIALAVKNEAVEMEAEPIRKEVFAEKFKNVVKRIKLGDSYLLNLTFPTKIDINLSLNEIFQQAEAPYKLLFKDEFVVYSPECFVRIFEDSIYTYPMKGTIDANEENAEEKLLQNDKERWEHNTIVDLLRNDLSMIADAVTVEKFRYIEKIKTHKGDLLQTSSEIKGDLRPGWEAELGEILLKLLPAGSISGAPKKMTMDIIQQEELDARGYYTGVFGIYDGKNLDSAIAIRYIEQKENQKYFRSGGGITANSNMEEEYQELIQKVYVPTV